MNTLEKNIKFKNYLATKHLPFLLMFIPAVILIFWKCRYGFGNLDECFYLTIPYRLVQGDAMILNEWHLSQLSSLLLYPFVFIYTKINGNLDGAILCSRYICAALIALSAVVIYSRLSKYSSLGAAAAAVCYTLFIPYNIMSLCYNELGILCLSTSLVIHFTAVKRSGLQWFICGMLFAMAVLCNPYLILVYGVYVIAVLFNLFYKKSDCKPAFSLKALLFATAGAAFMAAVVVGFILSRCSVSEIIKAIPLMLEDPEHGAAGFLTKTYYFFANPLIQQKKIMLPAYFALFALGFVCLVDRKRSKRKLLYYIPALLLTFVLMLQNASINYINQLMWAINFIAAFAFLLSCNENVKYLFWCLWVPGMLFSFCMNQSSNQLFFAISSGAAVAVPASIVIMCMFAKELWEGCSRSSLKACVCVLSAAILVFQLASVAKLRYEHIYWDSVDIREQNIVIEEGVNSGIIVSQQKYELYHGLKKNLAVLENYDIENILFLSEQTWYYLESPYRSSAYCAILSGINENTLLRLQNYYELCPDKMPDAVFVELENPSNAVYPDTDYRGCAELFCTMFGYTADEYENCLVLLPTK